MSAYSEDDTSMHSNLSEGGAELGQLRKNVPESEEYDTTTTLFEEPQDVSAGVWLAVGVAAGAFVLKQAGPHLRQWLDRRRRAAPRTDKPSIGAVDVMEREEVEGAQHGETSAALSAYEEDVSAGQGAEGLEGEEGGEDWKGVNADTTKQPQDAPSAVAETGDKLAAEQGQSTGAEVAKEPEAAVEGFQISAEGFQKLQERAQDSMDQKEDEAEMQMADAQEEFFEETDLDKTSGSEVEPRSELAAPAEVAEPAQPEQAQAELSAGAGAAEGEPAIGAAAEQDEEGNQEVGNQGTEGNTGEESVPVPLKEDLAPEAEMGEEIAEARTETEPALEGAKDEEGLSELAQEEEESSQAEAEAAGKAAGEKSSSAMQESAPAEGEVKADVVTFAAETETIDADAAEPNAGALQATMDEAGEEPPKSLQGAPAGVEAPTQEKSEPPLPDAQAFPRLEKKLSQQISQQFGVAPTVSMFMSETDALNDLAAEEEEEGGTAATDSARDQQAMKAAEQEAPGAGEATSAEGLEAGAALRGDAGSSEEGSDEPKAADSAEPEAVPVPKDEVALKKAADGAEGMTVDKSEVETDDALSQNEGHTPEVSEAEDGGNGTGAGTSGTAQNNTPKKKRNRGGKNKKGKK